MFILFNLIVISLAVVLALAIAAAASAPHSSDLSDDFPDGDWIRLPATQRFPDHLGADHMQWHQEQKLPLVVAAGLQ